MARAVKRVRAITALRFLLWQEFPKSPNKAPAKPEYDDRNTEGKQYPASKDQPAILLSLAFRYLCQRLVAELAAIHLLAVAGSLIPTMFVHAGSIITRLRISVVRGDASAIVR